jgi:hypothetical protein
MSELDRHCYLHVTQMKKSEVRDWLDLLWRMPAHRNLILLVGIAARSLETLRRDVGGKHKCLPKLYVEHGSLRLRAHRLRMQHLATNDGGNITVVLR